MVLLFQVEPIEEVSSNLVELPLNIVDMLDKLTSNISISFSKKEVIGEAMRLIQDGDNGEDYLIDITKREIVMLSIFFMYKYNDLYNALNGYYVTPINFSEDDIESSLNYVSLTDKLKYAWRKMRGAYLGNETRLEFITKWNLMAHATGKYDLVYDMREFYDKQPELFTYYVYNELRFN